MAARSVQISVDEDLLRAIDRRPETKREGRSAVIRAALRLYLQRKHEESTDQRYTAAYGRGRRPPATELDPLIDGQAWPDDS